MDWKSLITKIDVAMLIGLVTGILYFWGWVYWSNYYHFFGLPYSFGTLGFERLTLAGSWFLWLFVSRGAVGLLLGAVAFGIVRGLVVRYFPNWSERTRARVAGWTCRLSSRWVVGPAVVLLVCGAYDLSLDYIRRDAVRDAEARMNTPSAKAVVRVKGKAEAGNNESYDLLEQRDGIYYLLRRQTDKPPELVVLRSSELESVTVQRKP